MSGLLGWILIATVLMSADLILTEDPNSDFEMDLFLQYLTLRPFDSIIVSNDLTWSSIVSEYYHTQDCLSLLRKRNPSLGDNLVFGDVIFLPNIVECAQLTSFDIIEQFYLVTGATLQGFNVSTPDNLPPSNRLLQLVPFEDLNDEELLDQVKLQRQVELKLKIRNFLRQPLKMDGSFSLATTIPPERELQILKKGPAHTFNFVLSKFNGGTSNLKISALLKDKLIWPFMSLNEENTLSIEMGISPLPFSVTPRHGTQTYLIEDINVTLSIDHSNSALVVLEHANQNTKYPKLSNIFWIIEDRSGRKLELNIGANNITSFQLTSGAAINTRRWNFLETGRQDYRIRSVLNEEVITLNGASRILETHPLEGENMSQVWTLIPVSSTSNEFWIQGQMGLCLEAIEVPLSAIWLLGVEKCDNSNFRQIFNVVKE